MTDDEITTLANECWSKNKGSEYEIILARAIERETLERAAQTIESYCHDSNDERVKEATRAIRSLKRESAARNPEES